MITVTSESGTSDQLILMQGPDYSSGFDNGYDSQKAIQEQGELTVGLFVMDVDGSPYSTWATNDLTDQPLTFQSNYVDTRYTLTFGRVDGTLILLDYTTGAYMNLTTNGEYVFSCATNQTIGDRFVINPSKIPQQEQEPVSGQCGDTVSWTYYPDANLLTIEGTGRMWDFDVASPAYREYSQEVKSIIVTEGIVRVGNNAFSMFPVLETVGLSNSIQSIGSYAFERCPTLYYVNIPEGVTVINESTFNGCYSLTAAVIPSSVTEIGEDAYTACRSLMQIDCYAVEPPLITSTTFTDVDKSIPLRVPRESITAYQKADYWSEFSQIVAIDDDIDPDYPNGMCGDSVMWMFIEQEGVLGITGSGAMHNYSEKDLPEYSQFLQMTRTIGIEDGVTTIGDYAFAGFVNTGTAAIGTGMQMIGTRAFYGCGVLKSIICYAPTPPSITDGDAFDGVDTENAIVYVPTQSIAAYLTAPGWSNFKNFMGLEGDTVVVTPSVTIFGQEIDPTQTDSIVDIFDDGTLVYDPEENTLTLTNLDLEVGEDETVAINYTGDVQLTIVLTDSSSIKADTVIASTADIVITGDGHLVVEGNVPIVGTPESSITFDCNMSVRSVPLNGVARRRQGAKFGKRLDETGGPALSGFGSADFNKVNVTPSDAMYGPVNTTDGNGEESTINALYVENGGEQEIVTEFEVTVKESGVQNTRERQALDMTQPMFNVLGQRVDATYKGVIIQNKQTFILQ